MTQTTEIAWPVLDSEATITFIDNNVQTANQSGDLSTDFKQALINILGLEGRNYSLDDLWKRYQVGIASGDSDVIGPPSRTPPGHGGQHPHHFLPPGRLRNPGNANGFPQGGFFNFEYGDPIVLYTGDALGANITYPRDVEVGDLVGVIVTSSANACPSPGGSGGTGWVQASGASSGARSFWKIATGAGDVLTTADTGGSGNYPFVFIPCIAPNPTGSATTITYISGSNWNGSGGTNFQWRTKTVTAGTAGLYVAGAINSWSLAGQTAPALSTGTATFDKPFYKGLVGQTTTDPVRLRSQTWAFGWFGSDTDMSNLTWSDTDIGHTFDSSHGRLGYSFGLRFT